MRGNERKPVYDIRQGTPRYREASVGAQAAGLLLAVGLAVLIIWCTFWLLQNVAM